MPNDGVMLIDVMLGARLAGGVGVGVDGLVGVLGDDVLPPQADIRTPQTMTAATVIVRIREPPECEEDPRRIKRGRRQEWSRKKTRRRESAVGKAKGSRMTEPVSGGPYADRMSGTALRRLFRPHRHVCRGCFERPARFQHHGQVRADRDHTLCFRWFRSEVERQRARRALEG
jgi:hypothetical protein